MGPICRRIRTMRVVQTILGFFVAASAPLWAQVSITTKSLPFGGLEQSYNAQVMATGGTGAYAWSITGTPPPGLEFSGENGQLVGYPSAVGTYSFTVKVTDRETSASDSKKLSIGVMQISTPTQLPDASTCAVYSLVLTVSDGPPPPYSWSFSAPPSLNAQSQSGPPAGFSIDPNTGLLRGRPASSGSAFFSVTAYSNSANVYATKGFSLQISDLCFVTNTLPDGDLNSFYRISLIVSGGSAPLNYSVRNGTLPSGLTVDSKTGLLTGTPTTVGTYTFTLQVSDSTGAISSQFFTVNIHPALAFVTASPLPPGTTGVNYSQTFAATGGLAPYTFNSNDTPPGLTLTPAGVLSGIPIAGTFPFTVSATDATTAKISSKFELDVGNAGPLLQVSTTALTFTAPFEGDSPPAQFVDVTPVGTQPLSFRVLVDAGAGTPAPGWISVKPVNAFAPGRLVVSVAQGTLAAQTATARILVVDPSGNATIVTVTLNIVSASPQLVVTPDALHFAARSSTAGALTETIAVRNNGGGGPISFTTVVQNNSSWISGISPASGQTVPNSTVFLKVTVNTQGLEVGAYHDVILFSANGTNKEIPVALFVSGSGAILNLSTTGIRFQARQGSGYTNSQTIQVLNTGDPAASFTWSADFVTGSEFFTGATSGTTSLNNPGVITVAPTAGALQKDPGGYYALLKVSTTQALNSPLYVVLVLDLASSTSPALPDPNPAGLVFIGTAGKPFSSGQLVTVNTSSTNPASFQVSVQTADGGSWLSATPSSGNADGQTPGQVTVTVDASSLSAGIYSGEVEISMSGELRSVNITVIVEPPSSLAAPGSHATVKCSPAALALNENGLVNNFSVPAGWPAALNVQVNDDCGNAITNGSVTASFSNGDPPLSLRATQAGAYSTTWQPGTVSPQMTVTVQAQAAQLKTATAILNGSINQNQNAPPVVAAKGVVNTFNRVPVGALAPGMIIEVYGTGLATTKGNPGVLPLPTSFQGTSLIVGPYQAPLYYVSDGQLDVQVASELTANQQYPVIAILNGAISIPVLADIAAQQLGVDALDDGHTIAQHGADSSNVTANSPAKPGEVVVIYLTGMGATNPSVKSGQPAPTSEPLARVAVQPTVSLDGQAATVQFAGLAPGFVGLYQVNFQVPANAATGDLTLVVTQNKISSNATRLPVKK